jgi:hypothetical protein
MEMVLSRYGILGNLKRMGTQFRGCCPIHHGSNTKQFVADLPSNTWYCFGDECERGGGVIDFVALRENVSVPQAARLLAEWFSISPAQKAHQRKHRKKGMNARPSHRAYVIEDAEGEQPEQKGFWTRIGSAWPHKDGKGLNIQIIPGIAVSGRIVLREYTAEDEAMEAKRAKRGK